MNTRSALETVPEPHTPGPWRVGGTSMNPHLVTVVGPNGAIVAEPHIGDAPLIAAAPLMQAALQRIVKEDPNGFFAAIAHRALLG